MAGCDVVCLDLNGSIFEILFTIGDEVLPLSQVLVPGPVMRRLLQHHGATEADLVALESGAVHTALPPDPAPVMTHRQIAFHRLLLGPGDRIIPARTHAVTQIPQDQIASTRQEGSRLNFKRSGTRYWPLTPDSYSQAPYPTSLRS